MSEELSELTNTDSLDNRPATSPPTPEMSAMAAEINTVSPEASLNGDPLDNQRTDLPVSDELTSLAAEVDKPVSEQETTPEPKSRFGRKIEDIKLKIERARNNPFLRQQLEELGKESRSALIVVAIDVGAHALFGYMTGGPNRAKKEAIESAREVIPDQARKVTRTVARRTARRAAVAGIRHAF